MAWERPAAERGRDGRRPVRLRRRSRPRKGWAHRRSAIEGERDRIPSRAALVDIEHTTAVIRQRMAGWRNDLVGESSGSRQPRVGTNDWPEPAGCGPQTVLPSLRGSGLGLLASRTQVAARGTANDRRWSPAPRDAPQRVYCARLCRRLFGSYVVRRGARGEPDRFGWKS